VREWTWDQIQRITVEDTEAVTNIRAKNGTVSTWSDAELAKIRDVAIKTWEEWSKKTPLAKRAYDSQLAWLRAIGVKV
jgi:TRAP-type mannitol/chloroaromatic compound transport system substrate-binding protein